MQESDLNPYEPPVEVFEQPEEAATKPKGVFSGPAKAAFVFAGVILPIICFALTAAGPPEAPKWQSGDLNDYVSFLLSGSTAYVLYPLLAYAMICFCLLLFRMDRFVQYSIVRIGVYSGIVLALHFSVVLWIVVFDISGPREFYEFLGMLLFGAITIGVPWAGWLFLRLAWRYRSRVFNQRSAPVIAALVVPLLLIVAMAFEWEEAEMVIVGPFFLIIFGSLLSAPFWTFGVYTVLSFQVFRARGRGLQFNLAPFLGMFTWFAAYLAAARASVQLALEQYAQLPTEKPAGCYVASAAANGHPWLVRSRIVDGIDGQPVPVNRQLAYLKCGELALKTLCPPLHRRVRQVYDAIGPILARRLQQPLAADCAYLALKPCEWATRAVLSRLIGDLPETAGQMYGSVLPTGKVP